MIWQCRKSASVGISIPVLSSSKTFIMEYSSKVSWSRTNWRLICRIPWHSSYMADWCIFSLQRKSSHIHLRRWVTVTSSLAARSQFPLWLQHEADVQFRDKSDAFLSNCKSMVSKAPRTPCENMMMLWWDHPQTRAAVVMWGEAQALLVAGVTDWLERTGLTAVNRRWSRLSLFLHGLSYRGHEVGLVLTSPIYLLQGIKGKLER